MATITKTGSPPVTCDLLEFDGSTDLRRDLVDRPHTSEVLIMGHAPEPGSGQFQVIVGTYELLTQLRRLHATPGEATLLDEALGVFKYHAVGRLTWQAVKRRGAFPLWQVAINYVEGVGL